MWKWTERHSLKEQGDVPKPKDESPRYAKALRLAPENPDGGKEH
jgi:hypothetical protein